MHYVENSKRYIVCAENDNYFWPIDCRDLFPDSSNSYIQISSIRSTKPTVFGKCKLSFSLQDMYIQISFVLYSDHLTSFIPVYLQERHFLLKTLGIDSPTHNTINNPLQAPPCRKALLQGLWTATLPWSLLTDNKHPYYCFLFCPALQPHRPKFFREAFCDLHSKDPTFENVVLCLTDNTTFSSSDQLYTACIPYILCLLFRPTGCLKLNLMGINLSMMCVNSFVLRGFEFKVIWIPSHFCTAPANT